MQLSAPQRSVLETELYFKNTSVQNIGGYMIFEKKIEYDVLNKAFNRLLENADGLRIKISTKNNEAIQEFKEYKYEPLENAGKVTDIDEKCNQWMTTPFNIYDKLYAFRYFEYNGKCGLSIILHHLISDAWSIALVVSKIVEYYDGFLKNEDVESSMPSYSLFLYKEQEYFKSDKYKKDMAFWDDKFSEKPAFVSFTQNTTSKNPAGKRKKFVIKKEFRDEIEEYCNQNKISVAIFFEAILSVYGARINNQDEITLCSMGLNRTGKVLKDTIGNFSNILPMRVKINWDEGFLALCKKITEEHFEIYRHQNYPFQNIMQSISEKHGTTNIYDIMVSYQNAKFDENEETKYVTKWVFNGYSELNFMFNISDMENTGDFDINIDYRIEAFSDKDIENIYDRLIHISHQVIDEFSKNSQDFIFKDLEIVTPKEKETILVDFNNTKHDYPRDMRVYDNLEENAKKNPSKPALYFEGKMMTYREFNEKVNSLADAIIKEKVGQNNIIGIMFERSFDMLIAIYAVVKSGNTYMPIDPHFPSDRIAFMLEDSKAPIILTNSKYKDALSSVENNNCKTICLDSFDYDKYNKENPNLDISANDTAYCIYTSGSTGKPKGAVIRHHSVINRIFWMHDKYELKEDDIILQKTPYTFDVSVWELFWWSLKNASLRILIPEGHKDPEAIVNAIYESKVTHIHFVPSMLNAFLEYMMAHKDDVKKLASLKFVFASGEALQSEHVKKFYNLLGENGTTLHNLYGPTECTVDVSYYDCDKDNIPESIPIGKPVDNTQLIILDKACNLLPIGVPGELHISGELVGNGYINRDELTKEKFIKNTFYNFPTMYKTGDLCSWAQDGNIEYLGRIDNQIKIRGLRVELGDIENAILKDKNISECVVTVVENSGEKYLCGYFSANTHIDEKSLRQRLSKELPDYMVPSYFVCLEKLPLNANGKIDRKALPLPNFFEDEEYVAPENELESKISDCICKVLKREKISVTSDLLTSGLTSLSVIIALTALANEGIDIKIKDIYENRTIKELAALVSSSQSSIGDYSDDEQYRNISDIADHHAYEKKDGGILLTGATGFLGIHLLDELYKTTSKKIYCLIRNKIKFEEYIKLFTSIKYPNNRIVPIIGDISDKKLGVTDKIYKELFTQVSDIYHSAASVSFFCPWEKAKTINYIGTCNVIKFAEKSKAKLHHISTMSVSGDILTPQTTHYPKFLEENLYIGQLYKENVYSHSKYLAEKEIIKEIRLNRLNASIYRLPNLTWRIKDGVFQINYYENDLYLMTKVMYELKLVPDELKDENFLFTPVDDLAKAIVLISQKESDNRVYHFVSSSSPTIGEYMETLADVKYKPMSELYPILMNHSENASMQFLAMYLKGILKNTKEMVVHVESDTTQKTLVKNGFKWSKIGDSYIKYWEKIGH